MYVCMCTCVCVVYVCMYVCMYVCVYVCVCVCGGGGGGAFKTTHRCYGIYTYGQLREGGVANVLPKGVLHPLHPVVLAK